MVGEVIRGRFTQGQRRVYNNETMYNQELEERVKRIKASIDRINKLLKDLRSMEAPCTSEKRI